MECCSEKVCESLSSYRYSWEAERQKSNESHALKKSCCLFLKSYLRTAGINGVLRVLLDKFSKQVGALWVK